jgi:parallel beta-helix repeat protein
MSAVLISVVVVMIIVSESTEAQSRCGSAQTRVNNAAAEATVNLPDGCVYRESVEIKKPVTLIGGPGTEIRGSDVWSNWTRNSSGYWVSERSVPGFEAITEITDPQHPYPCKDGTSRCKWPEQVFLDGKPLEQVASDPESGQFAVTDARRVILADDPAGSRAEVTVRERWLLGRSGGVTIEGFAMKHAANGLSNAAIKNNGHPNWTLKNNDLSYAHGAILAISGAAGLRMEGNEIHHGGLLGVSSTRADLEAVDNEIHDNNTEGFYPAWKSAGMKVANASRFVASGNEVYNNDHTGIWVDNGSEDITLSNNRVHHNAKRGIHIEISDHAEVLGNVVYENGWRSLNGAEGVGISATASRDVRIYGNTLAWNASGVAVVNSKRETGVGGSDPKYDTVSDVRVHSNTVLAEERNGVDDLALVWRKAYAEGNIYKPAANNRGYDNRYWYTAPEGLLRNRFFWEVSLDKLAAFKAIFI